MINEIKKELKKNNNNSCRYSYYIKVKGNEIFRCQDFLIKNGFLWNSGCDNLDVQNIPIKYYRIYYQNRFRILYSDTEDIDFTLPYDSIVDFKDLIKVNFKPKNFIDNLFESIKI